MNCVSLKGEEGNPFCYSTIVDARGVLTCVRVAASASSRSQLTQDEYGRNCNEQQEHTKSHAHVSGRGGSEAINPNSAPDGRLSQPAGTATGSEMLWSSLVDAEESPSDEPSASTRIAYLVEVVFFYCLIFASC